MPSLLGKGEARPECVSALKDLSEFRLLLAAPEFQDYLQSKKETKLKEKLASWSSDLLFRIYAQLDSGFLYLCPEAEPLKRTRDLLGQLYLESLGIEEKKYPHVEKSLLLRGLVILKDDRPTLISKVKKEKQTGRAMELLGKIYGKAQVFNGSVVVSDKEIPIKKLNAFVKEICRETSPCLFWHPSALWKVVLVEERGVASYVPEIHTLVLSSELVEDPNVLMKVVVLHELAHAAEEAAWNLTRAKWTEEFAAFSGWTRKKDRWTLEAKKRPETRSDLLTELSKGSAYSILPDAIYVPEQKGKEGFVFEKSYTESLKRDDPSEDLADSIAVFLFAPERFCFNGVLTLSQKAEWIQKKLFSSKPLPPCSPLHSQ